VTDRDPDYGHDCGPECECFGPPYERVARLRRDILASRDSPLDENGHRFGCPQYGVTTVSTYGCNCGARRTL
jgi:hypothetical protein